ncbi:methyltransferase-like protein 23 isoform X2 [Eutrema salsugineum]|uniref:methyltransferase-like protein 23 isoform X2 n=1 Tax=Eutrema salsugineum TaxID=72664 RepID=UPI000CED071C|nr:methyltransferase-like protein 23 isoform X2 [Eutrema salsugineum]
MTATTTTISQHDFNGDEDSETSISISIIENMKEEYGLFVWPCSVILAEYVWQQRSRFRESAILELGAGTSLPGLVAAKVGANVTLTDDSSKPEVLENMRRVCELNKLSCNVMYWVSLGECGMHPYLTCGLTLYLGLMFYMIQVRLMISLPPSRFCFKVLLVLFLSLHIITGVGII